MEEQIKKTKTGHCLAQTKCYTLEVAMTREMVVTHPHLHQIRHYQIPEPVIKN